MACKLAKEIIDHWPEFTGTNSMGCSEKWYDPYYAIKQTFTEEEIMVMSETELNNLVKLADKIADGLY